MDLVQFRIVGATAGTFTSPLSLTLSVLLIVTGIAFVVLRRRRRVLTHDVVESVEKTLVKFVLAPALAGVLIVMIVSSIHSAKISQQNENLYVNTGYSSSQTSPAVSA